MPTILKIFVEGPAKVLCASLNACSDHVDTRSHHCDGIVSGHFQSTAPIRQTFGRVDSLVRSF